MIKDVDELLRPRRERPPAARFPGIGAVIAGRIITKPEMLQQRDFRTKEPLTWPDGEPRWEVAIQLRLSDEREVTLYAKGNSLNAVRDAIADAGAETLEIGGYLKICYVGDDEDATTSIKPKCYDASYKPPAAGARVGTQSPGVGEVANTNPWGAGADDSAPPF